MDKNELERVHEGLTRAACATRPVHGRAYRSSFDDHSQVPGHVWPALVAMARKLGYPVVTGHLDHALGETSAVQDIFTGEIEPVRITLTPGMTEASRVRVLSHELGHALLSTMRRYFSQWPEGLEEAIVESSAALVTSSLRCTDGRFSTEYLAKYSRDTLEGIRPVAVRLASRILDGISA